MHPPINMQLWAVALWLIQLMAKLVTLVEQHMETEPPTVVIQATGLWEAALAHVKLQEGGLGVHLYVKVAMLLTSHAVIIVININMS